MGWALAECAEVSWRVDNAPAKMVQPDAIGQHATKQRMIAAGQVPGEGKTASRGTGALRIPGSDLKPLTLGRSDGQIPRLHRLLGLAVVATMMDARQRYLAWHFAYHVQKF